jgi:hypothetical protein
LIGAETKSATIVEQSPRPATPLEFDIWARCVDYYREQLARKVWYALTVAEVASAFQPFCDRFGLPSVWSAVEQARIDDLLYRYNTIGRLIAGVEEQKYYITIERGDVTISAPAKMTADEYGPDVFPGVQLQKNDDMNGLGIAPLVVLVVAIAAVVLVASLYATIKAVEYIADMFKADVQRKIAQLDAAMATQPKVVFDNYMATKKANTEQIKEAAKAAKEAGENESWWDKFLGTVKNVGAAVGIGLLVWLALTMFGKVRRETASTKEG